MDSTRIRYFWQRCIWMVKQREYQHVTYPWLKRFSLPMSCRDVWDISQLKHFWCRAVSRNIIHVFFILFGLLLLRKDTNISALSKWSCCCCWLKSIKVGVCTWGMMTHSKQRWLRLKECWAVSICCCCCLHLQVWSPPVISLLSLNEACSSPLRLACVHELWWHIQNKGD